MHNFQPAMCSASPAACTAIWSSSCHSVSWSKPPPPSSPSRSTAASYGPLPWNITERRRQRIESDPATQSVKPARSEEHTSELQSHVNLVCRLLLEKKKKTKK